VLKALRIRDFRLLWSAQLISSLGSWLLVIALPAQVFRMTGSLAATGFTLAAEYLPAVLLGPIAGVVTDRWDRRRLMIASDMFRIAAVALMVLARNPGTVWLIYLGLIAEATGTVLFRPAAQAHTPVIVGTGGLLSSANSLNAVTDGTVRLIGGPLGAVLLAIAGFDMLIWADAGSYLVSAVMITMTSRQPALSRQPSTTIRTVILDLIGGIHVLRTTPLALALLPVTTLFLAANAALSAVLVPFGVSHLGGSQQTSLLISALGVGFLLGAPAARAFDGRIQPKLLMATSQAGTAVGFFLLFHSSSLPVALPAGVIIGFFGSITLVTPQTLLQRVTPNAVLGRISTVFFAAEAIATLAGALLGPTISQATSLSTTATVASIGTFTAAGLTFRFVPLLRGRLR
jgi:MFS family permease